MRRAVARGRMFPQSYSTDRRYGRLSLKAIGLFPLMWSNADDQGRLCGDPEEIKYAVCPNIDHITKRDIPALLQELQENKLILCYDTPKSAAIQMLDWWDANQKMQWAWPSDYQPPEGWKDHLRYKRGAKEVVTYNWPISGEHSGEDNNGTQVSSTNSPGESSGEHSSKGFPHLPKENIKETIKRKRRGRGNSPEDSGEKPSPSLTGLPLLEYFNDVFPKAFGRKPVSRETAQLRDLEKEISSAGGAPAEQVYDAFKEACGQNKLSVSYVRAVLLDWLGLARSPPA
ncbi:hypothetical protein LCGC14_1218640 [marine sediment metagenome]|uniref:Uncharacterized protein n=1 Tax=marine sediment metagenome TaxID=412755 RepID=A0A0F9LZ97_9ZZZZ